MFITFEGPDGCGKSTQSRLMAEKLEAVGYRVVYTREPGGTDIGRKIRQIVLSNTNEGMSPVAEALLYAADRAQHVFETIGPALKAGYIVVSDRFVDSSFAYQAVALNVGMDEVKSANDIATGGLKPDLTILLDVDPETGIFRVKRSKSKGSSEAQVDRIEARDLEYHGKVRKAYLDMAAKEPGRIKVVDAKSGDVATVHSKVSDIVMGFLSSRGVTK
ncbi:MAG TPA: dTMP kinase [Bacillota bacterium]|nr:dTMP kinase [Bacillota bacterium]